MEDDFEESTEKSDTNSNSPPSEPKLNGGNKQKSYLYYLSSQPSFQYFKKVVLVSSPKDQYVPFYSARVQVISYVDVSITSFTNKDVHY